MFHRLFYFDLDHAQYAVKVRMIFEEVCWLVKSGLQFAIMVVTIRSIPTDGTVDWKMLVSRFVPDQA